MVASPRPDLLRIGVLSDAGVTLNNRIQSSIESLQQRVPSIKFDCQLQATVDFNTEEFYRRVHEFSRRNDALILNCRDEPLIRRAIEEVTVEGTPIVCVTTDIPNSARIAYVGMDQLAAGATAAYILGRFAAKGGRVILVVSGPYHCQEQRESGFRRILRSEFPNIYVEESMNSNDEDELSYSNMNKILARGEPTLGIYNTAGGNAGIAKAIRERDLTGRIVFIAHEANDTSLKLLELGQIDAVLAHDIDQEVSHAVEIIQLARQHKDYRRLAALRSRPTILLRYNSKEIFAS